MSASVPPQDDTALDNVLMATWRAARSAQGEETAGPDATAWSGNNDAGYGDAGYGDAGYGNAGYGDAGMSGLIAGAPLPPLGQTTAESPPLAAIGIGLGMTLRLSQIGIRTSHDLARADVRALRVALGDASRFLDLALWVSRAQSLSAGL